MPENPSAPENQPWTPPTEPPAGQRMARGAFSENDAETPTTNEIESASQVEDEYFPDPKDEETAFDRWRREEGWDESEDAPPLPDPGAPKDHEMGLFEHLGELRTRLLYSFLAVGLAMCLTWTYREQFQEWFARPILKVLKQQEVSQIPGVAQAAQPQNQLISTDPTGFFSIAVQFSLVAALILTMPFLLFQVWRFIEPALTNNERRFGLVLTPFSVVLFFLGAGLGYAVSPLFFRFFLSFQPTGVAALWDYHQCISLMAKMLLVFGICFQVPVITIFLNKIGILSRNVLIEYWRHAVVAIFTVVAVLTPTWDPLTMTVCAVPPCLLYGLSIWIIKWI